MKKNRLLAKCQSETRELLLFITIEMISRLLFHLKKQLTFHMNMLDIFFRFLPRFTTTIMLLYVSLVSSHWVKLLGVDSKQKKLQWSFDCILVSPRPPVPHSKVICLSPTHSNFQNYPHPKLHPALSTCYQILITSPKLIMYLCTHGCFF